MLRAPYLVNKLSDANNPRRSPYQKVEGKEKKKKKAPGEGGRMISIIEHLCELFSAFRGQT